MTAMEGVVNSVAYAEGRRVGDVAIPDISEVLKRPDVFVWVGLHDPSPDLLEEIQREFGLHDLAIEDARVATSGQSSSSTATRSSSCSVPRS